MRIAQDARQNRASTPQDIAEHVAGRLGGVKWHDGYFQAFCPAHDNTRTRALSVQMHDDGVGVRCHGSPQCSTAAILDAVGMHPAELFVSARLVSRNGKPKAQTRETRDAATYTYLDADGRLYMRVQRTADKRFIQQRYDADAGKYVNGLNGTRPIPYHAEKLAHGYDKARTLFIVEGEKDADRLIAEGSQATTAPMGAGKWRPEYADQLSGYEDVRVIPDNDPAGRAHAAAVLATLPNAGLVELDGLPEKGDVSDWLDAGHTAEQLEQIEPVSHTTTPTNDEPQEHPFPVMDDAAYRGIFGEIVRTIEPHTEADPVAILLSALAFFGSSYGRRGYVEISGTRHHGNLFVGIVGDTARARKGTSLSPVKNIFGTAAPEWTQNKIVGGLSSGEGLINVVRDAVEGQNKDGDIVEVDKGVPDKRLLVAEGELSQGLKVLRREGNTLSPILRNAWDGGDLATLTRNSPLRATGPHISILGHITSTELLKHLVEGEAANGFGNRFLWACVRRSKRLPFGGELSSVDMSPIIRGLRSALDHGAGRMSFAENARDTWVEMYDSLTEDRPGMFGMITARAEAQTLRLAILYALAAGSNEIGVEHLASAYAVWGYCEDSALHLFGDQLGDADADKLVDALRSSPEGMTRTEIRDLFGRNKKPEDLQRILNLLEHAGKAYSERAAGESGGRPTETWFAA